ncbi:MAG: hypothetical protein MJ249_15380 [Kiritimatiellae bacterium]|nr:hypothetical protein [Kiritimatiellia bacterium]
MLKAFQQYIDAEQEKARKRLILICVFFGGIMFVVIAVFVGLLVSASSRNQMLNDRIVEYMMRDREQRGSAVVVQPSQDSSAIHALTSKLDDLQKKLAESQAAAEKMALNAAAAKAGQTVETLSPKGPTHEELEIARLKALLAAEREKTAVEREKQRQAELEEYRRKHYPELYEKKAPAKDEDIPAKQEIKKAPKKSASEELLEEVDKILNESKAVSYFDDDETEDDAVPAKKAKSPSRPQPQPAPKKEFSIPVDVRGSSSRWSVPNE